MRTFQVTALYGSAIFGGPPPSMHDRIADTYTEVLEKNLPEVIQRALAEEAIKLVIDLEIQE